MNTRHDPRITSRALSISHGAALTGNLAHTGVIGASILPAVERPLASSVLPDIESSGVFVFAGISQPPARCAVVRPLLTSLQVAPSGSPHVRTRCFPARPPHLPPRLNLVASLCCASSSPRRRPSMRFLSVSPLVSASLPSPGRLPSRSWPRVVGLSCRHAGSSYRGLAPHLQRAHDGRTQVQWRRFVNSRLTGNVGLATLEEQGEADRWSAGQEREKAQCAMPNVRVSAQIGAT